MDFRRSFDATPWNHEGYSAFGLRRENAKILALVFIISGLVLMDPPFDPIPNDIINLFIATWLQGNINISFNIALLSTYFIIGPALFFIGIWIYPYHTETLFWSYVNKAKRAIIKYSREPLFIVIGLVMFYIFYKKYTGGV